MAKLLVTLHGALSDNQRLIAFAEDCRAVVPNLVTDTPTYGEAFPLRLAIGDYVRALIVRTTQLYLETIATRYPAHEVTVLCHSFGTYALGGALRLHVPNLLFENIALCGSILPQQFEWGGHVRGGIITGKIVNFVRPLDLIVSLSRLVDGGFSGCKGFSGPYVCNLFKDGGHHSFYPDDVADVCCLIDGTFVCAGYTHRAAWTRRKGPSTKIALACLAGARQVVRNPFA